VNILHDALLAPAADDPRPFLFLPGGGTVSFRDFGAQAEGLAGSLAALGLAPGERIAIQMDKSPAMLAVVAAAIRAGIVFLPLNTAYTAAEVTYFVKDAGAKVLLTDPHRAAALAPVARSAGARLACLGPDGQGDLPPSPPAPVVPREADDLAALLYTSGTTGRSKGAMLTHRNLLSNAEVLVRSWGFTDRDVLLHALPVFHTHGLFVATNVALLSRASMIFLPRFDADEVMAVLPRATAMMGVPTFYTRLLAHPGLTREATAHVRLFISGSAPLLAETHRAWEDRTGHRILERYGMTETNMNATNPLDGERRAGTVGRALPGVDVRVRDHAGRDLPDGEVGVIEVRGPNVFKGYWGMPEKTREEIRPDGFFITGDLGVIGPDGYLTIVGRGKDLIISGGLNIYPKEVEEALDALPGVEESAVFGVPHPDFGEAVVAAVVPVRGASLDQAALTAALGAALARFKQPKHIAVLPALPRNAMGKVQKAALRTEFAGLFAPD
jgi:malonyl-CoA/methylmalonyl-CoA synthetase